MKMKTRESTVLPTQAECTICLCNDSPDIGLLKCKHTFCFPCIESWSEHENSCPLCKTRFVMIDRIQMNVNDSAYSQPVRTRVKIKKRNQADYDARHPSSTAQGSEDDVSIFANFMAGLIGQNNLMGAFLSGSNNDYAVERNRYGATVRAVPPALRRNSGIEDFLSSARLRYAQPPLRRAISAPRRTHGSENNPIELSDDENANARVSSSSSSRAQPRATSSTSSNVVDLIDLTDDAEYVPSSSSTSVAATLAPPVAAAVPRAQTVPPLHPTTAMSSFGNYSLMDFLSDDEEEDEDYEPPAEFDLDEEMERDDSSELSEDGPTLNEVIELPDSDEEDASPLARSGTGSSAASARLSGIMVWCRECDSYHDKQRVWDDVGYCPSTHASLMRTDGFSDIRQDRPEGASSSNATNSSRNSEVVRSQMPSHQAPLVAYAYSVRVISDVAEDTSDDSTTSAQWHDRSSRLPVSSASTRRPSLHLPPEEEIDGKSELARTSSDATTTSSSSRTSQALNSQADECTQCSEDEGVMTQKMPSANTTQSTSSSESGKASSKRSNWLAYMEENEDSPQKRARTESIGDANDS